MVRFDSDLKPYVRLSNQDVEPYLMGILMQKMQMNPANEPIWHYLCKIRYQKTPDFHFCSFLGTFMKIVVIVYERFEKKCG